MNMEIDEIWKTIPDTNNMIQISNLGRVKSNLSGKGKILKTQTDKKGYQRVSVTINKRKKTYKVHRLVAIAFISNPDLLPQVNHKDGNKNNNIVTNLEWITNEDNAKHAINNNLWPQYVKYFGDKYEKHCEGYKRQYNRNPLNVDRITSPKKEIIARKGVEEICFNSVSEAERYFESRHISDAAKGKRKTVKGWKIEYKREVV